MKKTNLIICRTLFTVFVTCIFSVTFLSCSDNDEDISIADEYDEGNFGVPLYDAYAAKYEIVEEGSKYKSIELTESGNYIITTLDNGGSYSPIRMVNDTSSSVLSFLVMPHWGSTRSTQRGFPETIVAYGYISGNYTVIDENTFHLEGFGTLEVTKYSQDDFYSLVIIPENGIGSIRLKSSMPNRIYNSWKSRQLCRTWDLINFRFYYIVDGYTLINVEGRTYEEMAENLKNWAEKNDPEYDGESPILELEGSPRQIIFTMTGTYAVLYSGNSMAVSTWSWAREDQGIIAYSWDNIYDGDSYDGNVVVRFKGDKAYVIEAEGENDGLVSDEMGLEITMQEAK